jgi:hypothetical protein
MYSVRVNVEINAKKLIAAQEVKKLPSIYGIQKVHCRYHKSGPLNPMPNQKNLVHIPKTYFFNIKFNTIVQSTNSSSKYSVSY